MVFCMVLLFVFVPLSSLPLPSQLLKPLRIHFSIAISTNSCHPSIHFSHCITIHICHSIRELYAHNNISIIEYISANAFIRLFVYFSSPYKMHSATKKRPAAKNILFSFRIVKNFAHYQSKAATYIFRSSQRHTERKSIVS